MTTTPQRRNFGTKASNDPTFHPSRDIPLMRGDETSTGQQVFLDQGEEPARAVLFGKQGRILWRDSDDTKYAEPENLSRLSAQDDRSVDLIRGLDQSKVPVSHWAGNKEGIHVVNKGLDQAEGYYRPSPNVLTAPEIGVEYPMSGQETLLHEMGHAHHYDTVKASKEVGNPSKMYRDRRGLAPDPLKEGIADAYVDRYGGHHSPVVKREEAHQRTVEAAKRGSDPDVPVSGYNPWGHINDNQFGYSARYEETAGDSAAWDDPDRVLYAGTRAHYGETGDIPRYQAPPGRGPVGSSTDATIAHLMEHSPHARAAWSSLSLGADQNTDSSTGHPMVDDYYAEKLGPTRSMTDVAHAAIRRHKDRTLLNSGQFVQESLFGEPHMERNQLGEIPRTAEDVGKSLGPGHVWEAREKGFQ